MMMNTRQALELAHAAIHTQIQERRVMFGPQAGSDHSRALDVIKMILDQRGCEVLDPEIGEDNSLTHLMDIIIWG